MSDLFSNISKIIPPNVRIELYSSLNQHLVDSENVILWNEDMQEIDKQVYEKFKEAIKKGKTCSFYTLKQKLPFEDFCIALLCSVNYSLNHKTVPLVLERTYTFAWRSLVIISVTSDESVRTWLQQRLNGRTLDGYTNSLGVNRQNMVETKRRFSNAKGLTKLMIDEDKIAKACASGIIRDIGENTGGPLSSIIAKSTDTPEGQLLSLQLAHQLLISRNF